MMLVSHRGAGATHAVKASEDLSIFARKICDANHAKLDQDEKLGTYIVV